MNVHWVKSLVKKTIKNWNQLIAGELETFYCNPNHFRTKFKKESIRGEVIGLRV
jgi:hypothetical protein